MQGVWTKATKNVLGQVHSDMRASSACTELIGEALTDVLKRVLTSAAAQPSRSKREASRATFRLHEFVLCIEQDEGSAVETMEKKVLLAIEPTANIDDLMPEGSLRGPAASCTIIGIDEVAEAVEELLPGDLHTHARREHQKVLETFTSYLEGAESLVDGMVGAFDAASPLGLTSTAAGDETSASDTSARS